MIPNRYQHGHFKKQNARLKIVNGFRVLGWLKYMVCDFDGHMTEGIQRIMEKRKHQVQQFIKSTTYLLS